MERKVSSYCLFKSAYCVYCLFESAYCVYCLVKSAYCVYCLVKSAYCVYCLFENAFLFCLFKSAFCGFKGASLFFFTSAPIALTACLAYKLTAATRYTLC